MKNILQNIMMASMLVACATSPTLVKKVDSAEVQRKYGSQIQATSMTEFKYDNCPVQKKIETEKSWKTLMSFGNGCINKSQWSLVEFVGERLSQVEPDAPWGAYYLSVSAENRGYTERALWMVDLALKKSDKIGILRYQKGRILWKKQFFKEAISEIQAAIDLDGNIKDAHVFLGQIYLRELNFDKATKHFDSALNIDSRNYGALFGLASCYIELDKTKEAIGVLDSAISKYPKALELRIQEAYVYENLTKQSEVALSKYKQLQNLVLAKKVDGAVPFDLNQKIKVLEEQTAKMRQVASQKK